MDHQAELIRSQMLDTRTALTEKLEALETKVTSTVTGTTDAVTDTVDAVKDAVKDTVDSVQETMHEAVDSVKEAFDFPAQVRKHPWLMFTGAVAVGYVSGSLLEGGRPSGMKGLSASPAGEPPAPPGPSFFATTMAPFMGKLVSLAVGAAATMASDAIQQHVPEQYKGEVTKLFDSLRPNTDNNPTI